MRENESCSSIGIEEREQGKWLSPEDIAKELRKILNQSPRENMNFGPTLYPHFESIPTTFLKSKCSDSIRLIWGFDNTPRKYLELEKRKQSLYPLGYPGEIEESEITIKQIVEAIAQDGEPTGISYSCTDWEVDEDSKLLKDDSFCGFTPYDLIKEDIEEYLAKTEPHL